ncbi:Uncharacterized conserved protein YgiB, involved in bioifilm formation, UPF0441/DUF1190 family [Fulvimarina manganoxydans]|uniref:Uncharacterized conserved protein YgiB, involved in bioifilm formation, UPF0441/DUF1190 family n=1 Tax=Fulvimarina manganoxydans TaxID=937218 RepID=A0A1W2CUI1_9HYPH|nr:DUF1190 domain-containing protein [Fulvimarina manganoxydans]SMC88626.1 Uncharacterized conserved protein YgiB, involved in bioifilm formation, UPF0441/DUF1190 family [Fulvimarina manganoxydans]
MRQRKLGRRPLLALGTIAATSAILTGCGDDQPTEVVFDNPTECAASGVDLQICQAEYQRALQAHLQSAPHFNSQAACEQEYGDGRCLSSQSVAAADGSTNAGSDTGSFFIPFMTGYLVSSAIGNLASYGAYRNYVGGPNYSYSRPIYRTRSGDMVTSGISNGQRVSRPVNVNTRTVSRSGFGGRSSSRGFFGG